MTDEIKKEGLSRRKLMSRIAEAGAAAPLLGATLAQAQPAPRRRSAPGGTWRRQWSSPGTRPHPGAVHHGRSWLQP